MEMKCSQYVVWLQVDFFPKEMLFKAVPQEESDLKGDSNRNRQMKGGIASRWHKKSRSLKVLFLCLFPL